MAISYTSQAIASYNASPPTDAGAQAAENEVTWSGIKTKIGDPLKTLAEAINTELVAAFAKGAGVTATNTFTLDQIFSGSVAHGTATFDGDGFISAKGLRVGATATTPGTSGMVVVGGFRTGTATEPSAGHLAIGGGIRIGPTATEPSAGYIMAKGLTLGTATEANSGGISILVNALTGCIDDKCW